MEQEQFDHLVMLQTVQRSAYLALVRHLAGQGCVDLAMLVEDVQMLGQTQPDAGWREGHVDLAGELELLRALPSLR